MAITIATETTSTAEQRMLGSGPGLPPALPNYPAQSTTTIDGGSAALFGLPFMAAGVFIGMAAFNVIQTRNHAPLWLIAILGAMFFSAGFFLFAHGIRGLIRKAIYTRKAAETPGQAWLFDFHWRPEGIHFSAFNAMLGRLLGALAVQVQHDHLAALAGQRQAILLAEAPRPARDQRDLALEPKVHFEAARATCP